MIRFYTALIPAFIILLQSCSLPSKVATEGFILKRKHSPGFYLSFLPREKQLKKIKSHLKLENERDNLTIPPVNGTESISEILEKPTIKSNLFCEPEYEKFKDHSDIKKKPEPENSKIRDKLWVESENKIVENKGIQGLESTSFIGYILQFIFILVYWGALLIGTGNWRLIIAVSVIIGLLLLGEILLEKQGFI